MRKHLYVSTLLVVFVLVVAGAFVVQSRSPVEPSQNTITWGGGAPVAPYTEQPTPQQILQQVIGNQNPTTLTLPPLSTSTPEAQQSASGSYDYQSLIDQLSLNTQVRNAATTTDSGASIISRAYQFIPTGLVATTAPAKKPMSELQKSLYDYGNGVGGEIQSFETLHTNQAEILKDQAQDRTDPAKAAALTSLGQAIAAVGTSMKGMQDVPNQVSSQHTALAQSYFDIGAKLQLVAQAQTDGAFIQAIENYDTAAETFIHNYASLAQFLTAQGVVFAPQDPGSVFSFTPGNSF